MLDAPFSRRFRAVECVGVRSVIAGRLSDVGIMPGASQSRALVARSRRWSLNTLLRGLRAAWWEEAEFRAVWPGISTNWVKKEGEMALLWNAVAGTARI